MIERAHLEAERQGIAVWNMDEAGPYQTVPQPGQSWQPVARPKQHPHEYFREGTAKMLTLLHPGSGQVRVKGVVSATNEVLHGWLKEQLSDILAKMSPAPWELTTQELTTQELTTQELTTQELTTEQNRQEWESWQEGLTHKHPLLPELPRLRMLLIIDNLAGHHTPSMVNWLMEHGIMPLYTPLGGSWLNMAESVQRILSSRALNGTHPHSPEIIIEWLETTARAWNREPTPFIWGGKRKLRRDASRLHHALAGSTAYSLFPIHRTKSCSIGYFHPK